MANQEQNPPQQEQPFVAAKQVGFNLKDIILNPNNEVALLYPEHNNKDHFKCVSDFISKCKALENYKVYFLTPTGGIYGEVGLNAFRNAIGAHYLPHYSEYVAPPSIDIVRPWFETIRYGEAVPAKGTLKKSLLPPRWSINNWALKPDQPEEPPFTDHMLAICVVDTPVHSTSSKQSFMSSKEATKGGSSKAPIGFKIRYSKKRKESSSAMDSNPSQPPVSILVDTGMHKEDQQATSGLNSLGVTSEERGNPQPSSGMSAFNLNKPIYSTSFIIHSESHRNDASTVSTADAITVNLAPMILYLNTRYHEGTKNTSCDHLFSGTDPYVLADQTKSVSEGLKTVLTQPITGKGASSVARKIKEETSSSIKLEDLAKLVSHVQPSFKDLDSPEDDPVIVVDDTIKMKSIPPAQPSFPNVEQLNELLVKSLKIEFSNILSVHDFSSSLPTELKDLPSKFNKLTKEVKGSKKQVHELEIELPGDLKEIPTKLKDFTKTVASVQAKLKTLDALPSLLLNVTQALNKFAQVLNSASSKAGDHSVPLAGQADTRPTKGEKDTNQATISQLFQRRANKNAEKDNLNKNKLQTETTPPPNPTIITTTITQMQSPSLQPPPKSSSQPEGEHIKEGKGKKALSLEEAKKESTGSDSDDETHVTGSMKLKRVVSLLEGLQGGKILLYVKRNKTISLGNVTSNVGIEFKFEGDNTPIVIQPPCYSASKIPRDQQVVSEPSGL
ncbi:hypothetical protein Tco_0222243 [Tanacetum coccineum]